jgi:hypothetical protein
MILHHQTLFIAQTLIHSFPTIFPLLALNSNPTAKFFGCTSNPVVSSYSLTDRPSFLLISQPNTIPDIQTPLRDIAPRANPPTESKRVEVLQVRIHAQRFLVGGPRAFEPAFWAEGLRVRAEGFFAVNGPLAYVDICASTGHVRSLRLSTRICKVIHIVPDEQMLYTTCSYWTPVQRLFDSRRECAEGGQVQQRYRAQLGVSRRRPNAMSSPTKTTLEP